MKQGTITIDVMQTDKGKWVWYHNQCHQVVHKPL